MIPRRQLEALAFTKLQHSFTFIYTITLTLTLTLTYLFDESVCSPAPSLTGEYHSKL